MSLFKQSSWKKAGQHWEPFTGKWFSGVSLTVSCVFIISFEFRPVLFIWNGFQVGLTGSSSGVRKRTNYWQRCCQTRFVIIEYFRPSLKLLSLYLYEAVAQKCSSLKQKTTNTFLQTFIWWGEIIYAVSEAKKLYKVCRSNGWFNKTITFISCTKTFSFIQFW